MASYELACKNYTMAGFDTSPTPEANERDGSRVCGVSECGEKSKIIQAMLPNLLCRVLCVASQTVATLPDAVVGMSDDRW